MTDYYDRLINMRDSRTAEDEKQDQILMENLSKMAEEDSADPKNYKNTQGKTGFVSNIFEKIKKIKRIKKLIKIKAYKIKRR